MRRMIASAILLTGIFVSGLTRAEVPVAYLAGKSGTGLASAVRRYCRPDRIVEQREITRVFRDHFNGVDVSVTGGVMPDGYVAGELVPSLWWSEVDIYGDTIARDLYNLIPMTRETVSLRGDIPPGQPTELTFSNPWWSVGQGQLFGSMTRLYSPPESLRGQLARTFFYMAVMYPHYVFTPQGMMVMSGEYPYMTPYAVGLFTQWAREYPVGPTEAESTAYASGLQGGSNPFVEIPGLMEYLWGDRAGDVFSIEGERTPLHSTYISADDRVYLYSPAIPADASWSIDGRMADADSYSTRELGAGVHHLEYTSRSTGETGRVMIKIEL